MLTNIQPEMIYNSEFQTKYKLNYWLSDTKEDVHIKTYKLHLESKCRNN